VNTDPIKLIMIIIIIIILIWAIVTAVGEISTIDFGELWEFE